MYRNRGQHSQYGKDQKPKEIFHKMALHPENESHKEEIFAASTPKRMFVLKRKRQSPIQDDKKIIRNRMQIVEVNECRRLPKRIEA